MLVTQSHVSAAISSSIVVLFTGLLFFSGYILQQRTVTSLHSAIRPQLQALKTLPQAQGQPPSSTIAVGFGDAAKPLLLSADSNARLSDVAETDTYEYLEASFNDQAENDPAPKRTEADSEQKSHAGEEDAPLSSLARRDVEAISATWGRKTITGYDGTGDSLVETPPLASDARGKLRSLDDWTYSDETEGQKRMREGPAVLKRWTRA